MIAGVGKRSAPVGNHSVESAVGHRGAGKVLRRNPEFADGASVGKSIWCGGQFGLLVKDVFVLGLNRCHRLAGKVHEVLGQRAITLTLEYKSSVGVAGGVGLAPQQLDRHLGHLREHGRHRKYRRPAGSGLPSIAQTKAQCSPGMREPQERTSAKRVRNGSMVLAQDPSSFRPRTNLTCCVCQIRGRTSTTFAHPSEHFWSTISASSKGISLSGARNGRKPR